jgi:hypothetical protein
MELLAKLDLARTNAFFATFFRLPDFYWRGFLSSRCRPALLWLIVLLSTGAHQQNPLLGALLSTIKSPC